MPPDVLSRSAPMPILFTHFGDQWIRGSEVLLLDLLRHLDPARFRPIVWCNGMEMAEACRAAGFTTQRTDFAFYFDAGSPRFSPRIYAGLVREGVALARQHEVQVLHANSAAPTQWLVPVARTLRVPLLSHLHIDYLRRSRYALLLHQADLVVGVSRQVLDEPIRDGVPKSRTAVIYNGIDFGRLDAKPACDLRTRLGIGPGAVLIGAAGSLITRKGHDVLLRAAASLPDAPHVLLAGDGPERAALTRLADELGMAARVHVLGHLEQVADLYATCDIIALASRADSFGLVLVEAGYCRRPVVATRVGGLPEVVADEETGLLVPPNDVPALAAALGRLAADAGLRGRMGAAGRARAMTRFSATRMAAEFAATYERLAALPRSGLGWSTLPGRAGPYTRMFKRVRIAA